MPKKTRKSQFKLMAFNRNQRIWIYEAVDPETGRTFYVGRTIDMLRRGVQHDRNSSACKQLRAFLILKNFKFGDVVRVVPELPNGVPASRAAEFEAYFINQRDTIYHPERRPDGCNLRQGDNVTSMDYQAIKQEIEDGFEWGHEDEEEEKDVPEDVINAIMKEAVLEACVADLGDQVENLDPDLCMKLTAATMERKHLERLHMSSVLVAELLAAEYEQMPNFKEVDRSIFERDLNVVRDRLNAEAVPDEKMLGLVRAIALFGKSEGAEWEMRAHVAVHAFKMLAGALETREEARMPDNTVIQNMKLVRNWVADNGGKKPSPNALKRKNGSGTLEEQSRGTFLTHWKSFKGKSTFKQANKAECNFLMRKYDWWKDFCTSLIVEKGANLESKVNSMLKEGYAHKDEPGEFEGKKKWPCGSPGTETCSVYKKMKNMVEGMFAESAVDKILMGIHPVRARWYKSKSTANRPLYLDRKKERSMNEQARGYANGIKPRSQKKRKMEGGASSSKPVDAEDDEEDEEEDDEDDDEEDEDEDGEEDDGESESESK
jgi:hypothetical protein